MKHNAMLSLIAAVLTTISLGAGLFLGGCSKGASMVSSNRAPEFFDQFKNPAINVLDAKDNLAKLNVIETGADYPMRFVLFDDGRFYYQVDKLGDGTGYWSFEQGGVQMTAVRPIFDMHITLSAREAEGSETLVRFYDRHGFNSVNTHFVQPGPVPAPGVNAEPLSLMPRDAMAVAPAAAGTATVAVPRNGPAAVPEILRPYIYSDKGI